MILAEVINLSIEQLSLCAIFLFLSALASFFLKLQLGKELLWASVRCVLQLAVLALILKSIFNLSSAWLVSLFFLWMIFWAARTVRSRVKEKEVAFFWPVFGIMTLSYFAITAFTTKVIVGTEHWHQPQYFITLGGMVAGNSLNAITLGVDRLFSELRTRRSEVEAFLSLGATPYEACRFIRPQVMKAAMIPSINSMMTVGLVSIPGMMTGQILAGSAPEIAVKYQIMVMFMINASTCLVSIVSLLAVERLCFTKKMQLKLR